jgi:hypothetical protein
MHRKRERDKSGTEGKNIEREKGRKEYKEQNKKEYINLFMQS